MIKKWACAVATTTLMLLGSSAEASDVSFQTRASTLGQSGNAGAYQTAIEGLMSSAPSAGYCDAAVTAWSGLSNQGTCGGVANDIAFDITAVFGINASQTGVWQFRVGPDFGRGGALFIDGIAQQFSNNDMWWNGSYGDPNQILVASLSLGAGNHIVEAYGFEGCCDGSQQAQFLAPGSSNWQVFSAQDGLRPQQNVPEPGTLVLTGLGLLGLATRRKLV